MTPADIGRLTLRQLEHVYARDPQKGPKKVVGADAIERGPVASYRELFFFAWRKRGLTESAIGEKWREFERSQKRAGKKPGKSRS